jgi:hypothetical protein
LTARLISATLLARNVSRGRLMNIATLLREPGQTSPQTALLARDDEVVG